MRKLDPDSAFYYEDKHLLPKQNKLLYQRLEVIKLQLQDLFDNFDVGYAMAFRIMPIRSIYNDVHEVMEEIKDAI